MKRRLLILVSSLLLLILPFSYNACGMTQVSFGKLYGTTGTGNPFGGTQASQEILFAICSVLDRCGAQVPFNVCLSDVPTASGIGARLGLAPGVDDPYSSLENAEASGTILANSILANTCTDTINNLSCGDPNVQNAYNASSSTPFAAVAFMVPINACGQVFTPSVQSYACTTKVFLRGVSNTSTGPSLSGNNLTYSIAPALPQGLNLDPNTGIISGTPTVVTPMTAYTINAGGSSSIINLRTADGYLVKDLTDSTFVGPGAACTSASGTCNLRSAIQAANNSGSSQVIVLPAGTSTLTLGALNIASSLDVYGDCATRTTIDGNAAGRIFNVTNSALSLNSLIIQNALLNNAGAGAGLKVVNSGVATFTVNVNNSVFQNNIITGNGASDNGAAIDVEGNSTSQQILLNISNTTFSNNQNSGTLGTGIIINGLPGNPNTTQVTIDRSAFISNKITSPAGAPIWYEGGSLTVTNSLFYNNTSNGAAGVLVYENGVSGTINWTNDTFDSNSASGVGGAGVMQSGGLGASNFTNCTFANNSGATSGVLRTVAAGNLANNIFYNNGANCSSSTMTSIGGNLSDTPAADCNLNQASDIVSTNPQLGPLQNNGGSTQTRALSFTSAAIAKALVANCPSADQRGYIRHLPARCDTGAYEHTP